MAYKIILHNETLGVTKPALQALRNEITRRVDHMINVMELPADADPDGSYGFLITDNTAGEAVIIGDGFRKDGGGEGGAGHRAAQALLRIFGISAIEAMPEDVVCFSEDESLYRDVVDKLIDLAEAEGFKRPAENRPEYVDWVFARKV